MGKEVLAVSEEKLAEVIRVIRADLKHEKVSKDVRHNLTKWCKEEEAYLKRLAEE